MADNLILTNQSVEDISIDLIYLDPPFNSGRIRQSSRGEGFDDRWRWDQKSFEYNLSLCKEPIRKLLCCIYDYYPKDKLIYYLTVLASRLMEFYRVLKPSGSLYLHIDPGVSHYIKLILDAIFGRSQFMNEIIWTYKSGGASGNRFARKHDVILFYAKNVNMVRFNTLKEKSYNRNLKPYRFKGVIEYNDHTGWYTEVNMKDVWFINMVGRTSGERCNWPTQKPEALLERIILASSEPGDTVFDPYCGSGTTLVVAERLGRKWIGIDANASAIEISKNRLESVTKNQSL